jgi:tryptophan-rich sensory protein
MRRWVHLFGYFLLTVGGGWLIGYLNLPGAWHEGLVKPGITPPNWAFPLAWTILYVLIAIAGWRVGRQSGRLRVLWRVQLALNFAWSPLFFSAHRMGVALADIGLLLIVILAFIAMAWRQDRAAAALFVLYGAWVAFATFLNISLLVLN